MYCSKVLMMSPNMTSTCPHELLTSRPDLDMGPEVGQLPDTQSASGFAFMFEEQAGGCQTQEPPTPCSHTSLVRNQFFSCPGTSVARVLPARRHSGGLAVLLLVLVGCCPPPGPHLSWCIGDRPETHLWAADTTCKELTRVEPEPDSHDKLPPRVGFVFVNG